MNISYKSIIAGLGLALCLVSGLAQAAEKSCTLNERTWDSTECAIVITLNNKDIISYHAFFKIYDDKQSDSRDQLWVSIYRNGKSVYSEKISYPRNDSGKEYLEVSREIPRAKYWWTNPNGKQNVEVTLKYYPAGASSEETYHLGATVFSK